MMFIVDGRVGGRHHYYYYEESHKFHFYFDYDIIKRSTIQFPHGVAWNLQLTNNKFIHVFRSGHKKCNLIQGE